MGNNIRPFISKIPHFLKEDNGEFLYTPNPLQSEEDRGRKLTSIDNKLFSLLKKFEQRQIEIEKAIIQLKEQLKEETERMNRHFDENVKELEKIGIRFENGVIKLNNITLHLRDKERLQKFTDEEKIIIYDQVYKLDSRIHYAAVDMAINTGMIKPEKSVKIRQVDSSLKKGVDGRTRAKSHSAFHSVEDLEENKNLMNESIVDSIFNFFKNLFKKNDERIEYLESETEDILDMIDDLEKIVFSK